MNAPAGDVVAPADGDVDADRLVDAAAPDDPDVDAPGLGEDEAEVAGDVEPDVDVEADAELEAEVDAELDPDADPDPDGVAEVEADALPAGVREALARDFGPLAGVALYAAITAGSCSTFVRTNGDVATLL